MNRIKPLMLLCGVLVLSSCGGDGESDIIALSRSICVDATRLDAAGLQSKHPVSPEVAEELVVFFSGSDIDVTYQVDADRAVVVSATAPIWEFHYSRRDDGWYLGKVVYVGPVLD